MSTYGGHIVLIITRDRLDIPANISHMICFFRAPKFPIFLHVHHLHILKGIYFLNLYAFRGFIDTCLSIPEQIITTAFRRSFKSDTFIDNLNRCSISLHVYYHIILTIISAACGINVEMGICYDRVPLLSDGLVFVQSVPSHINVTRSLSQLRPVSCEFISRQQ